MTLLSGKNSDLYDKLVDCLGFDYVITDPDKVSFFGNDIFWQPGIMPIAVLQPENIDELAKAIGLVTSASIAVVPRGGGMSYSKGYLPQHDSCITIDCRRMNRVLEINTEDMYVTVEAGCTWANLHEALADSGYRTGYWGTLSGIKATIGGSLSQNSVFFGTGQHGTAVNNVLNIAVVLANGSTLKTGSAGMQECSPFSAIGGPNLSGLFLGDTGCFGIKAQATLRLIPTTKGITFGSFGFSSMAQMCAAQIEIGKRGLVAECFGIDSHKANHSASINRVSENLNVAKNVIQAEDGLMKGIKAVAKMGLGGANFLKQHPFSLHLTIEGRSQAEADSMFKEVVQQVQAYEGKSLPDTVPRVIRSKPFTPVRGMLGGDGQRWVPIHGIFPNSRITEVIKASDAFFAERKKEMDELDILVSHLTVSMANEFMYEPAFYWPDALTPLHIDSVGKDITAPWQDRPANEAARSYVITMRTELAKLYASLGGVNIQIARDYPFQHRLHAENHLILGQIKALLDPDNLINPGSLGLGLSRN